MQPFSKTIGLVFIRSPWAAALCIGLIHVAKIGAADDQQKPAKPQQLLARNAGTWDCDIKMFLKGPNTPPKNFKGIEDNKLVSGGKFLQTSFKYSMGPRREFEGHSLMGYDPRSKRYIGTWVDNMTSVPSQVSEEYDEASKTLTDHRTVVDGSGNETKSKLITTWHDDSTKKLEIFMVVRQGEKETDVKLMEIVATKRP